MQLQGKQFYLYVLIYGIAIAIIYYEIQPPNDYKLSHLADANEYEKIYDHFKGPTTDYEVRFAIHNRLVIPFLASLLPGENISENFFIVNTVFALLSLLALYYLFRAYNIDQTHIILSLIYFSVHWVGPFRQNAISPIGVDMPVYLFEVIFLVLFIRQKYLALIILSPFAIAIKELFLALLVVFLAVSIFWRFYFMNKRISIPWVAGILILGVTTKLVLNYYYPSVSPSRNSVIVMAFHLREMFLHPDHLLRWILSLFAAFGAFLFLTVKRPINIDFTESNDLLTHILSISVLALSFLGGMDYTRLIFLGFPYIFISILKIGKPSTKEMILAFSFSVILTRFWKVLPNPTDSIAVYNSWMPEVADANYLILWMCTAFVFLLLIFAGRKIVGS